MPDNFLTLLFEHKAWCDRGLVAALRAAPPDADRRQMAVAIYTLGHISIVDRIFKDRLIGATCGFETVIPQARPDLEELGRTLAETTAWYLDYVHRAQASELAEPVDFVFVSDGEAGRMTRAEMLAHVVAHGASHRGAIGKMLETMGVPGAPDMVTTFRRRAPDGQAPPAAG